MDEKTYFNNNNGISVTNARFIVSEQTYAMSGVTSVKHFIKKASIVRAVLSVLLIALGALSTIGILASGEGEAATIIMPLIFLIIGISLWFSNKKSFIVLLNTSSGESQALETKDSGLVNSVVDALNEAIIERG